MTSSLSVAERDLRSKISYICGLVAICLVMGLALLLTGAVAMGVLGVLAACFGAALIHRDLMKLRRLREPEPPR